MKNFKIMLIITTIIISFSILSYYRDNENNIINTDDTNYINDTEEKNNTDDNKEANQEVNNEEPNKIPEQNNEDIAQVTETSTTTLSNQKCAWGLRRMKDGVQPEFTASYVKPLKEYNGIYVGNKDEKVIYLTFDEGYENGYTGNILDTLKEKEVTATFFVTKPYAQKNQELMQRMIDEGHIIGNHTVNHPSMPEVTDNEKLKKEIMGLHDYVLEIFNYEMTFLRPPKGEYSERTVKISKDLGYVNVLWSFAYDDWDVNKQGRKDYARNLIYNNLHNGAVILLHAVSKDNAEILGEVIDEIQNRGYEIRPLDEFIP